MSVLQKTRFLSYNAFLIYFFLQPMLKKNRLSRHGLCGVFGAGFSESPSLPEHGQHTTNAQRLPAGRSFWCTWQTGLESSLYAKGAKLLSVLEIRLALTAKADNLEQKTVVARGKQIEALGEQPGQIRPGVGQPGALSMKSKRHLRFPGRNFKLFKKFDEKRIGGFVEDDEARIHRGSPIRAIRERDSVRVPAQIIFLLENGHLMAILQEVRCHDPGRTSLMVANLALRHLSAPSGAEATRAGAATIFIQADFAGKTAR